MRTSKLCVTAVVFLAGFLIQLGFAFAKDSKPDTSVLLGNDAANVSDEAEEYQPDALFEDIEKLENSGKFDVWESAYSMFFRNFNLVNPTPIGAAASAADASVDYFFGNVVGDKSPKYKAERYRLSKARYGWGKAMRLYPWHPKAKEAPEHIKKITRRIDDLDKKLKNEKIVIREATRPEPKSWTWVLLGDSWWEDLGKAAPSALFWGPYAVVGVGIYEAVSIGQRAYQVVNNGAMSPEDLQTEIDYIAATLRIVPEDQKPVWKLALAKAYEEESSVHSLMKAVEIYAELHESGVNPETTKSALSGSSSVRDRMGGIVDSLGERITGGHYEYGNEAKDSPKSFGNDKGRVRENVAGALASYAKQQGSREMFKYISTEYVDTKAGEDAKELLESGKKIKPKEKKERQIAGGAGASSSGFDLYGSGYNLFGGERSIAGGVRNMKEVYGDVEVPWVDRWTGGRIPEIRGGPGRLSFVLNPAREKAHKDAELFSR